MGAWRGFDSSVNKCSCDGACRTYTQSARKYGSQHPEGDLRHAFIEALLLSISVKHAWTNDRRGRGAKLFEFALRFALRARVD